MGGVDHPVEATRSVKPEEFPIERQVAFVVGLAQVAGGAERQLNLVAVGVGSASMTGGVCGEGGAFTACGMHIAERHGVLFSCLTVER